MRIAAWVCVTALLGILLAGSAADDEKTATFELENGLRVFLRPVSGAAEVALCVVYGVGEDHDPEGQSGLAHLVEHCYVTAAAGDTAPRTAEEMMERYPQRWNAQTGARYTVICFVFPPDRLEAEIREAAARMGDLKVTEQDLEREVPRMLVELSNMFDRFPSLVARNRARDRVRPSPRQGRKGGVPGDVEGMALETVTARHEALYKPRNARLVLAGGFDLAEARALVGAHFGELPPGERVPEPGETGTPRFGAIESHTARGAQPGFPGHVCVAYPAPSPADEAFAPFVVLVARLSLAQQKGSLPEGTWVEWAPLDDPHVLYVSGPIVEGESVEEAEARFRGVVEEIAERTPSLADRALARQRFAPLLATVALPDPFLQANVYGLAFGIARRDQLGLDGEALGKALLAVDEAAFRKMAAAVLARDASAAVAAVGKR